MSSFKENETSLEQNNTIDLNQSERSSLNPPDNEIDTKLKWYENLVLQANDSLQTTTTHSSL